MFVYVCVYIYIYIFVCILPEHAKVLFYSVIEMWEYSNKSPGSQRPVNRGRHALRPEDYHAMYSHMAPLNQIG